MRFIPIRLFWWTLLPSPVCYSHEFAVGGKEDREVHVLFERDGNALVRYVGLWTT